MVLAAGILHIYIKRNSQFEECACIIQYSTFTEKRQYVSFKLWSCKEKHPHAVRVHTFTRLKIFQLVTVVPLCEDDTQIHTKGT